jgi:hypothetical protein
MPRFTVGDSVELNGLLGELNGGAIGTVVSVILHKNGISALDKYTIAFQDSRQLQLCSFQLTPARVSGRQPIWKRSSEPSRTISIGIAFTRAWKDGCQSLVQAQRH